MGEHREAFVGIDVAKQIECDSKIAEGGREGEVRYIGQVDGSESSKTRMVRRIASKYDPVHFCYEAGPTGYGLHRLISDWGNIVQMCRDR